MRNLLSIIFSICLSLLLGTDVLAQKAWFEPDPMDPTKPITLYVDIAQCECQKLLDNPGPIYLWTWEPADPVGVGGNGAWSSSNEAMIMTHVEANKWSITFTPTELYGKSKDEIFDHGKIMCLAKLKDGGSGGACDLESKTEDLEIQVKRPASPVRKVYSFPGAYATDFGLNDTLKSTGNEVFTILYDNKLEIKPSMMGLDGNTTLYTFIKAVGSDGLTYKSSQNVNTSDDPGSKTKMRYNGDSVFAFSFIPNLLLPVPQGVNIVSMEMQIVREGIVNSNDAVDGKFNYAFRCDE